MDINCRTIICRSFLFIAPIALLLDQIPYFHRQRTLRSWYLKKLFIRDFLRIHAQMHISWQYSISFIHGKEYTKVHKDVYLDNSYFEYNGEVVWYKTIIFCIHPPNKNKLCFSFQSTQAVFNMNGIKILLVLVVIWLKHILFLFHIYPSVAVSIVFSCIHWEWIFHLDRGLIQFLQFLRNINLLQ